MEEISTILLRFDRSKQAVWRYGNVDHSGFAIDIFPLSNHDTITVQYLDVRARLPYFDTKDVCTILYIYNIDFSLCHFLITVYFLLLLLD